LICLNVRDAFFGGYLPTAAYLFEREVRPAIIGILYRCRVGLPGGPHPYSALMRSPPRRPRNHTGGRRTLVPMEPSAAAVDKPEGAPARPKNKDDFDECCYP